MVFKDHLVVLWRSQRQFALATRLAAAALVIEIVGAMAGGIIGGARGLCIGWLIAMGVEMALGVPWLRRAFGGLHWRWPLPTRRRTELGRVGGAGRRRRRAGRGHRRRRDLDRHPVASRAAAPPRRTGCPSRERRCGPVSPAASYRRSQDRPQRAVRHRRPGASDPRPTTTVRELVGLAQAAGAQVISTSTSFRTMQPVEGQPIRFGYIDRTIGAARSAGLQVRLQLDRDAGLGAGRPAARPAGAAQRGRAAGMGRLRHPGDATTSTARSTTSRSGTSPTSRSGGRPAPTRSSSPGCST